MLTDVGKELLHRYDKSQLEQLKTWATRHATILEALAFHPESGNPPAVKQQFAQDGKSYWDLANAIGDFLTDFK